MAEDAGHHGELLALLEAERHAGVAEVVQTLAGQARRSERRLEAMPDVVRVERSPERCRKT